MAKKRATSVASKPKADIERDDIAEKLAPSCVPFGAQGNNVNPEKVREIAYAVADALIAYRNK
jgi:hypothetical protein